MQKEPLLCIFAVKNALPERGRTLCTYMKDIIAEASAFYKICIASTFPVFCRKNWLFCAQHHRVAHALLCAVHFVLPKADADEGTAAVTDHDRDGQRHHIVSMGFARRPPPVPCIVKRKESVSEL